METSYLLWNMKWFSIAMFGKCCCGWLLRCSCWCGLMLFIQHRWLMLCHRGSCYNVLLLLMRWLRLKGVLVAAWPKDAWNFTADICRCCSYLWADTTLLIVWWNPATLGPIFLHMSCISCWCSLLQALIFSHPDTSTWVRGFSCKAR